MLDGYLKMEPKSNLTSFISFQEYLKDWYAGKDSIEKVQEYSKSQPNGEAVGGWCEVDCGNNLKIFFLVMGVLSILMSTGRVGNALVALRCIDVRDKSLSLAFNVVFLSLIGKNLLFMCNSFLRRKSGLVVSRLDHEQDLNPKPKLLYHFYLSGMLPSPIIMGAIIDKTCTLWQMECGEQSNCILYDLDLMRKYVMSFTASIMIIGSLYTPAQTLF